MRYVSLVATAILLIADTSAAQTSVGGDPDAARASAASEPDASAEGKALREALTREILVVIEFERMAKEALDVAMPVVVDRYFPGLSKGEKQEVTALVSDAVEDVLADYGDRTVEVYVELFTEAELRAMLAFYRTPEGRSINAKTPQLAMREQEIITELVPRVTEAMRARGCARFGCAEAAPTA